MYHHLSFQGTSHDVCMDIVCSLSLTVSGDLAASPPAAFAANIAVTVPTSQAGRLTAVYTAQFRVPDLEIGHDLACS